jgi:hypothetical protein
VTRPGALSQGPLWVGSGRFDQFAFGLAARHVVTNERGLGFGACIGYAFSGPHAIARDGLDRNHH